jgi:hypothetical protein
MTLQKKVAIGTALAAGFAVLIAVGGFVVQQLWNWLVPPIFNVREVTLWQALGLLALCRILFGGFGKGGSHRTGPHKRSNWWREHKAESHSATEM